MAHAIKHYPFGQPTSGQRLHVFYIDTRVDDSEEVLRASGCRFCRLLAEALQLHGLVTPGQLDCVHDGSPMASIQMETMTPALAVTIDDVPQAYRKFSMEYANISSLDYDSIKMSLQACEQAHVDCKPDALDNLPGFKLIDCHTRAIVPAQSTFNTSSVSKAFGSEQAGYHYVALSYVWGPKRDESRIGASGALENLPQTIDDSIRFCKALGYRFLWVDRYKCIDQNIAEEKAIQIANMGRIYSSAQLTIISSAGDDPFYGLPGLTNNAKDIPFQSETIKRLTLVVRPLSSVASISASKWATRGWTYQEGYLSRRRLFFTNQGVHYICNATSTSSALHRFLPRASPRRGPAKVYSEVSDWTYRLAPFTRNLEAYTGRQLTMDSDALDAITGALNDQMMHDKPLHHLWGIPVFETDIDYDLTSSKNFSKGRIDYGARRRPGFPSWSFLGWKGHINYLAWPRQTHISENFDVHNIQRTGKYTFALLPTVIVNDPVGKLKSGYYVVAAVDEFTEAYIEVRWSKDPDSVLKNGIAVTGALFIDERKLLKELSSTTMLVLEKGENHHERVGICTIVSRQLKTMPASRT
ncbi:hypothetical protein E8E11_011977 [Didymella keratinophila]|nr:hypothetical protein E8E11_011977 [Didymella keratinophila]